MTKETVSTKLSYSEKLSVMNKIEKNSTTKSKLPYFFFVFFLLIALLVLAFIISRRTTEEKEEIQAATMEWQSNGIELAGGTGSQYRPRVVSDGAGGVIYVWIDETNYYIYAQRINSSGVKLWSPETGVVIKGVSGDVTDLPPAISDGSGGVIIGWEDYRSGSGFDIFVQKVNSSGSALWTSNGVLLTSSPVLNQTSPRFASDDSSGVIAAWDEGGVNWNILAQRVNSGGSVQWTAGGVAVSDLASPSNHQQYAQIVPDGSNGAIIVWRQAFGSPPPNIAEPYVQRLNGSGVRQWGNDGVSACTSTTYIDEPKLIGDGAGSAILTWQDGRSGSYKEPYTQRLNSSGVRQWGDGGYRIAAVSSNIAGPEIVSDGSNGAVFIWRDKRGVNEPDLYAQRFNSSGTAQWTFDGVLVSNANVDHGLINGGWDVTSDDSGNIFIIWALDYAGGGGEGYYNRNKELISKVYGQESGDSDIFAQMLNSDGGSQWTSLGELICNSSGEQTSPVIASSSTSGTFMMWRDARSDAGDIYGQRIDSEEAPPEEGDPCSYDSDCGEEEGYCVDGYCCDGPCVGTCRSCDYVGHVGECYMHPEATDADSECSSSWNSCDSTCVRRGSTGYCDGSGACETNETENIASGYICTDLGSQTVVSSSNYCNYDEDCDAGDCTANKWYTSCDGSGNCRSATDHTDASNETVFPSEGYTLTDVCGADSTAFCGYGDWACDGYCKRQRDALRCDSSHVCSYNAGVDIGSCGAGEACSSGICSVSNVCNASWKFCSTTGDDEYGTGGQYFCQANCDELGTCDYAVNCDFYGLIKNLKLFLYTITVIDNETSLSVALVDEEQFYDVASIPQNGLKTVGVLDRASSRLIAEIEVDFSENRDWSDVNAEIDTFLGKSVVSNLISAPGVGFVHTLYIPIPESRISKSVIICPNAVTLLDVEEECTRAILKIESDSDTSRVIVNEREYWKVEGLTSSGGISILEEELGSFQMPETGEDEPDILSTTFKFIARIDETISDGVKELRENESLVSVTENVGVPIAMIPLISELTTIALSTGSTLFISPVNFLLAFIALIKREKKDHWGIVYDRKRRTPIPFAVIRLESEKTVKTKVTDLQGRYSLVMTPGEYVLRINHSNYQEFSSKVKVKKDNTLSINTDIGLNLKKLGIFSQVITTVREFLNDLFKKSGYFWFLGGFYFSLFVWVITPSTLNIVIMLVYFPLFFIYHRSRIQYPQNWGRILDAVSDEPVKGAFVKIFGEIKGDIRLLDTVITDSEGKYGFLLDQAGDYFILAAATNYVFPSQKNKAPTSFYKGLIKVKIGKEKVLKEDFYVDPIPKSKRKDSTSPFRS